MRRTSLTIGILAAELAAGALAAPSALADDNPEPDRSLEPTVEPIPVAIRTGRAVDLPELPEVLPELPIAEPGIPVEPPPAGPPAEPPAPTPAPEPAASMPQSAPPASDTPAPAASPVPAAAAPPAHTVVTGDSLWEIAAAQVAQASGRDRAALGPVDIVGYWVRVCGANRERLRSGDLDLIFEGEVVELPPL